MSTDVITCPACGVNTNLLQINFHLDNECCSSAIKTNPTAGKWSNSHISPYFASAGHQNKPEQGSSSFSVNSQNSNCDKSKNKLTLGRKLNLKEGKSKKITDKNVDDDDCVEIEDKVDFSPVKKNNTIENEVEIDSSPKRAYFLENFLLVLKTVLDDPLDCLLFNDDDKNILDKFFHLSSNAQKLYVRMFQRKLKWNKLSKVDYPEIEKNLENVVEELNSFGFVETELSDLNLVLEMMSLPDLKCLLKELNLNQWLNKPKNTILESVMKHCRQQKTIFSSSKNMHQIISKKAMKILGKCFKIENESRRVFNRALLLFSLTSHVPADETKNFGHPALLILFFVNSGKAIYPDYSILRNVRLFRTREELIRFEEIYQIESDLISLMESNEWDKAFAVYQSCKEINPNHQTKEQLEHVSSLPSFLRRYSYGATLIRCHSHGVEILQRLHRYDEAVTTLRELLSQENFHVDYRGRWADRLALNLEQHLKQPEEALKVVMESLKDAFITGKHELSLHQRGIRLCKSSKNKSLKFIKLKKNFEMERFQLLEIPKICIEGRLLPANNPGSKSSFISSDSFVCSVEELAISHFRNEGYDEGIHGESSIFISIFCLLFWEIVYQSGIPDVFRSPHQIFPLDLNSSFFYQQRKGDIDERLKWISCATREEISTEIENTWLSNFEKLSLVSWSIFVNLPQLQGLINCVDPVILSCICGRLAKDYRHTRSGFPDLVVWNTIEKTFKVVEVKGPNDKLSHQQILWLNFLLNIGVEASVCHVTATNSKKLKKTHTKAKVTTESKKHYFLLNIKKWCSTDKIRLRKFSFKNQINN